MVKLKVDHIFKEYEKGKLVISNYDRSMTLNAEQVEIELKTAI